MTASDEIIAQDNLEVLQRNGFEIDVEDGDESSGTRGRLKLTAQPISKNTVFDMKGRRFQERAKQG